MVIVNFEKDFGYRLLTVDSTVCQLAFKRKSFDVLIFF